MAFREAISSVIIVGRWSSSLRRLYIRGTSSECTNQFLEHSSHSEGSEFSLAKAVSICFCFFFQAIMSFSVTLYSLMPKRVINISFSNSLCLTFSWTHHLTENCSCQNTMTCQLLNVWSICISISLDLSLTFNPGDHLSSLKFFIHLTLRTPPSWFSHCGHCWCCLIFPHHSRTPYYKTPLPFPSLPSPFFSYMH